MLEYNHLLNGIINSVQHNSHVFRSLNLELKHKLILSVTEDSPFPNEPAINVNFHFNGFKKDSWKRNSWKFLFYMYAPNRGVSYDTESYPELLKSLYEEIQEIARVYEFLKNLNNIT